MDEKTFHEYRWILRRIWRQKPNWDEDLYLWTPGEADEAMQLTKAELDLGIIKKTIYRALHENGLTSDYQIYHTVSASEHDIRRGKERDMTATRALNFVPDEFERERIEKAARGNRDALIDLAYLNISYDEEQHGWVLVNEPDDSLKALKASTLASARRSTEQRFRIWDNQSLSFVDEALCCIGADGALYIEGLKQDRSRYLIEHATGQIDKNSTEVYIGDIILCQYMWWGQPTRDIYLVKWDNYGRILPFHHIFHSGRELWIELFGANIEVIGNIHLRPHQEIPPDGWHSDLGRLPYV